LRQPHLLGAKGKETHSSSFVYRRSSPVAASRKNVPKPGRRPSRLTSLLAARVLVIHHHTSTKPT
jgi:hypothetical protein